MNDLTLQKAKALARRYRVVHACLTILAALLSLAPAIWAAFVLHNRYWMMLLTLFLYLVLRRVITFITYQKYVMGCLTKELDPPLYRALLAEVRFAAYPGVDHLFAAHYHGEHQTVIDLCAVKMADPKCARFSLFYLLFLAPTYFELGDMDALAQTLDRFDAYLATRKDADKQRALHRDMAYYRAFTKGDYKACRDIVQPLMTEGNHPLSRAEYSLLYAIACYRLGDIESARVAFAAVVQTVPKMHFAAVATTYLDAIDAGKAFDPPVQVLTPDPSYQPPRHPDRERLQKRWRLIFYAVLAVEMLWLLALAILQSLAG